MWDVLLYLAAATVAGCVISAVSALAWGPGATRELSRRLTNLDNRLTDVDDRITSEVKKRAQVASVESRRERRTDAELTEEALAGLGEAQSTTAPAAGGRVRVSGVFPAPRSVK